MKRTAVLCLSAALAFSFPALPQMGLSKAYAATCGPSAVCTGGAVAFQNSDGTTAKTVYTEAGNGAEITNLICTSNTASGGPLWLWSVLWPNGVTQVVDATYTDAKAGQQGAAISNLMGFSAFSISPPLSGFPTNASGNTYISLPKGGILKLAPNAAVAAATTWTCSAFVTQY